MREILLLGLAVLPALLVGRILARLDVVARLLLLGGVEISFLLLGRRRLCRCDVEEIHQTGKRAQDAAPENARTFAGSCRGSVDGLAGFEGGAGCAAHRLLPG